MSDTVSKADYDRLSMQFASLQREVETMRKTPRIDPQNLLMQGASALRSAGFSDDHIEHLRTVLIADKLGPQAPLQMQMVASQGPAMARTAGLEQLVKDLADQVKQLTSTAAVGPEREKLKTLIADKSKYPHLAKAYAANPDKVLAGLQAGTAEDYAKAREETYTEVLGPAPKAEAAAAASVNAETGAQSTKSGANVSAHSGLLNDVPVPQSKNDKPGAWSPDTYNDIKAQIVAETAKLVTPIGQ